MKALNAQTKSLLWPLVTYWLLTLLSLALFLISLTIYDGFDLEAIVVFSSVTIVGIILGQIAAILRLRESFGCVHGCAAWALGMLISIAIPVLGTYFMVYALLGSIFFFAGMWSLRAGRDVWACWPAILYGGGSAVIAANAQGKVSAWEAGNKLVVWDALSFSFFVIVVVAILFYLAIRERHRLFHWRYGARATMKSDSLEHSSQGQTRMGCGGWVGLTAFAVLLAMAAALTAPFLWHTAESDEGGGSDEPSEQVQQAEPEEQGRKKGKRKASQSDDGDGMDSADMVQRAEEMMEQAQKAAQQAFNILYYLLWILFILLMLYAVFYRPMHRLFWIRHYRQPLWRVPNTTRILNYWKLLCIGFRDAGVEVSPASSANRLLEAVNSQQAEAFGTIVIPGLDNSVEILDRVRFGLGVRPQDISTMEDVALSAYDTLWGRLGSWAQVRALYRKIDP
ncbi:MAG: hypothetical protein ACON4U_21395 [Myxococcota bacterium]